MVLTGGVKKKTVKWVTRSFPFTLFLDRKMYEPCSAKMGLDASTKSIDPDRPVQSAQADPSRNFAW